MPLEEFDPDDFFSSPESLFAPQKEEEEEDLYQPRDIDEFIGSLGTAEDIRPVGPDLREPEGLLEETAHAIERGKAGAMMGLEQARVFLGDLPRNLTMSAMESLNPELRDEIASNPTGEAAKNFESWLKWVPGYISPEMKEVYEKSAQRHEEHIDIYQPGKKLKEVEQADDWEFLVTPEWWVGRGTEAGTQMLGAIGANFIVPGSGLPMLGAMGGGNFARQADKRIAERMPDLTPETRKAMATGGGIAAGYIEMLLERGPLKAITGKITGAGDDLTEFVVKKIFDNPALIRGTTATIGEGIEETASEAYQMLWERYAEQNPDAFEGAGRQLVMAGALGSGMGMTFSAPGVARDIAREPQRRQERFTEAQAEAVALMQDQEARDRMREFAKLEQPSRADVKRAGFTQTLSKGQRQQLAATVREGLGTFDEDQVDIDQAQITATPETVLDKPPGPENLAPHAEKRQVASSVRTAFDVDNDMANAVADVIQSSMTQEEVNRLQFERGGKPGEGALYQIPEAVEKATSDPDFRPTGKEEEFFGEKGIWPEAVKAARQEPGAFKGGLGLKPEPRTQLATMTEDYKAKLAQYKEDKKAGKKGLKTPQLKDPFPVGRDFDAVVSPRGIRSTVQEAVKDLVPYIAPRPQFKEYYQNEVAKERDAVAQKHPELATDDGNWQFYRLLNGVASAQTDLFKNTQETERAYSGFKQAGRLPVVVDTKGDKPRPQYALPSGAEYGAALPGEVENYATTLAEMDKALPPEVRAKYLAKDRLSNADKAALKKYAKKYKDRLNTTSEDLTANLWHEFARTDDPEAFKSKARTAFEIAGGSSMYNKARNYHAVNALLDKFDGDTAALMQFLNERVSYEELASLNAELYRGAEPGTKAPVNSIGGLKDIQDTVWVAEDQDQTVPRTFVFGPKVGAYILNRLSDMDPKNAQYNTMDVWESRAWRSYFRDLQDTDMGIADGVPRRVYMRAAKMFPEEFKKATGEDISVSAGQAARWYFTMEMMKDAGYTKVGDKQTIARYTQSVMEDFMSQQLGGANPDMLTLVEGMEQLREMPSAVKKEVAAATPITPGLQKTFGKEVRAVKPTKKELKEREGEAAMEAMMAEGRRAQVQKEAREAAARGEFSFQEVISTPVNQLFQKVGEQIRGSMEVLPGGKVLLRGFEGSDVETAVHEAFHGLRRVVWDAHAQGGEALSGMTDAEIRRIEGWVGIKKPGQAWTRAQEEKFVDALVHKLRTGNAPTTKLKRAFDKISNYLRQVYQNLRPSLKMNDQVSQAFDQLLTRRERLSGPTQKADSTPEGRTEAATQVAKDEATPPTQARIGDPRTAEETGAAAVAALETDGGEASVGNESSVPNEYIDGDGNVTLYRYSKGDRGATYEIDPAKTKPSSYSRNEYQRAQTQRTFFYLNTSEKESIVGDHLYTAKVPAGKIYNLIKDVNGLKLQHKMGNTYDFDAMFKELQAQGFEGVYYNPGFHVVNMFTPVTGTRTQDISRTFTREAANEIWTGVQKQIRNNEPAGFTYDPQNGTFASEGYAVAPAKSSEYLIDLSKVKSYEVPQLLENYVGRIAADLSQPNFHLGGWVDDGILYLDASLVVPSEGRAMQIARDNNQLAIFNLGTGQEIRVNPADQVSEMGPGRNSLVKDWDAKQVTPGRTISKREVINNLLDRVGIQFTGDFTGFSKETLGYYRWIQMGPRKFAAPGRQLAVRPSELHEVGVTIHEVAHLLDDTFDVTGARPSDVAGDPIMSGLSDVERAAIAQLDYDPDQGRLSEGWAEAVRLWTSFENPSLYMGETAYSAFNRVLAMNEDLKNQINATKTDVMDYMGQPDHKKLAHALAAAGQKVVDPTASYFDRQGTVSDIHRFTEKVMLDQDYDLVLAEREIERQFKEHWNGLSAQTRGKVTADQAWDQLLRRAGGLPTQLKLMAPNAINDNTEQAMLRGVFDPVDGQQLTELSARSIFEGFTEAERAEFGEYMYAKVALERWEKALDDGREYVPGEVDIRTLQNHVAKLEAGTNYRKYRKAANEVTEYFNTLIDLQVRRGLLSGKEGTAIKDSHDLYMPFFRQFNNASPQGAGRWLGVGAPIKKLRGGSIMPVLDVFDAMIDRTHDVYRAVHKHNVETSFIKVATESGVGAPFITRIADNIPDVMEPKEMIDELAANDLIPPDLIADMRDRLASGKWTHDDNVRLWGWFVYGQPRFRNQDAKNIIAYRREDGSVVRYKVDPNVHRVMTFANSQPMAEAAARIWGAIGTPTAISRMFMVHLNLPYFATKNIVRDLKTAAIKGLQDTTGMEPGIVNPGVVAEIPKQWKQMTAAKFGEDQNDLDRLFRQDGGLRATKLKTAQQATGVVSRRQQAREKRRVFGGKKRIFDHVSEGFETIEKINDIIELAPRKAAYNVTLRELSKVTDEFSIDENDNIVGTVPQWARSRAMYNAMEITVNFNRRGQAARYVEPILLFYNAAMQGNNSHIMTMKKAATDKKQLARVIANITLSVMAKGVALAAMAQMAFDPEDEEDDSTLLDKYWEIPEYYKQQSDVVVVRPFGQNMTLALPVEREWKMIGNLAEEYFWKPLFRASGHEVPYAEGGAPEKLKDEIGGELADRIPLTGGTIPVALQLFFGYDLFRNRWIETQWDDKKEVEYRMDDRTAWAHRASLYGGKYLGLSPKEIDFLSRNTFGSMPGNLMTWAFTAEDPKQRLSKLPFAGPYIVDDLPRQSYSDYYEAQRRNERAWDALTKQGKQFTPEREREIRDREATFGVVGDLLKDIREAEGLSREMQSRYYTGLTRWALDRKPLAGYPNPLLEFDNEDLPLPLRRSIIRALKSAQKMPRKPRYATEAEIDEYISDVEAQARLGQKIGTLFKEDQE